MKPLRFVLSIKIIVMTSFLYGQSNQWQPSLWLPSLNLTSVCILNDGVHGYAAGSAGNISGIYRTTNGGTTWELMNFPYAQSVSLQGVYFVTPQTGWVFGSGGRIYKTTDGGQNWISQVSGTTRLLYKGYFLNENIGWIVGGWQDGTSHLVLYTSNGGATWQNRSFGNNGFALRTVFFIDEQTGWTGGINNQIQPVIYKTTDAGQSWTLLNIPLSNTGTQISSLVFSDPLNGWATVNSLYENPAGPVIATTDGGNTWSVRYYTQLTYNQITVRDVNHVAVIGMSLQPPSEKLHFTLDGGISWSVASAPINEYTDAIQWVGNTIWIAAAKSIILSTTSLGSSWNWENYSPPLKSIGWKNSFTGWAIAGTYTGTDLYAFKTIDGGQTWLPDPTVPGGAQVIFLDEVHGFMLKEGTNGRIYRTADGGQTWSQHNIGGGWIDGIFFVTPQIGWAHGSQGTLRYTSNGGVTWTAQNVGSTAYVETVWFLDTQNGWAGGGYGGGQGFISRTTNGGINWTIQTIPTSSHIRQIQFINNQIGFATTVGGTFLKTSDGGNTWVIAGSTPEGTPNDLEMISETEGYLITFVGGSTQKSWIYYTSDGGMTWTMQWEGAYPTAYLNDLSIQPGAGQLWACGNHSTIIHRPLPVGIHNFDPERNESTLYIHPNPVKENSWIEFTLRVPQNLQIIVSDRSGMIHQVMDFGWFDKGFHRILWNPVNQNGVRLHSGVYIISLSSENESLSAKVVVY